MATLTTKFHPQEAGSNHDEAVDLVIAGAGPAGTAAAIEARRQGLTVIVLDKAVFPRDKCCGDGLTSGALRHLDDLGLDPSTVPSWKEIDQVHLGNTKGRIRSFPLPTQRGQFAVVARRRELDAALVDLAKDSGADLRDQTPVTRIDATDTDWVSVQTKETRIRCRYYLAADGMWSPSRKMLGLHPPGYRGEWHAFRQYFRGVSERATNDLIVWFEPDLLPGYLWSFPLADGSANVGFGIQRGNRQSVQSMNKLWPALLARPHIRQILGPDAEPEDRHKAWPIPARLGSAPLSHGRVLFIGDAAAATDPMTGEGIGQALETGRLGATAIADAGPWAPGVARETYEGELRAGMAHDHRLASSLSTMLSYPVGVDLSMAVCGSTPWTRRNFARWLFEDYPRAVLTTPRRWRTSMFKQDGAYAVTA